MEQNCWLGISPSISSQLDVSNTTPVPFLCPSLCPSAFLLTILQCLCLEYCAGTADAHTVQRLHLDVVGDVRGKPPNGDTQGAAVDTDAPEGRVPSHPVGDQVGRDGGAAIAGTGSPLGGDGGGGLRGDRSEAWG